jgi:hypothetical protein
MVSMLNSEKCLEFRKFWDWLNSCPSKKRILKDNPRYVLVEFYVAEDEMPDEDRIKVISQRKENPRLWDR